MTSNILERRTFLKICSNAAFGTSFLPAPELFNFYSSQKQEPFRLNTPRWIIYEDGTFDLISNEIILKSCRPSINNHTVTPLNVYLGDSPTGKRIAYELSDGFLLLDMQAHPDYLSIGAELSGFNQMPRWFFPISQAQVFGADTFFNQGLGTNDPGGILSLSDAVELSDLENRPSRNWSYDSFFTCALIGNSETLAVGNAEHHNFLQRSTIYTHRHQNRLQDKDEGENPVFFEAGLLLNQINAANELVRLPPLFFLTGNKPYETVRELTWKMSQAARQESVTNYYWISKSDREKPYTFYRLQKQIDFLNQTDPPIPIQSLVINKGYCIYGDWLESNIYWPAGLEGAAREIFKNGFRAGIWVAPFVVSEESELFKRHPDWVIHDFNNKPIPETLHENETGYALDASHQDVKKYLRQVFGKLRKMGFIFYVLDFLDWGFRDSYFVKKASPGNSSVQDFREIMNIIREEIGHGSIIFASQTPFSPVIGIADSVNIAAKRQGNWDESRAGEMITDTMNAQYLNNILWQNNPGEIELTGNFLTENEKISLALWKAFLGGAVGTSDDVGDWSAEQLEFFRFLEPGKRNSNACFPNWPSENEIKIAVKHYKQQEGWGILVLNDKNQPVEKTISLVDLNGMEQANVFEWKPFDSVSLGEITNLILQLLPHQSRLFWLSGNNNPPPSNMTIGGRLR